MSIQVPRESSTFTSLLHTLQQTPLPLFFTPDFPSPLHPSLTASIASLQLHPCLEALLHILNHDLSSSHFLVRHMPSAPEGMLIHAILHRVEGDLENAMAWYGDARKAGAGIWDGTWGETSWSTEGGEVDWEGFMGRIRRFKAEDFGKRWSEGEREDLRVEGEKEVGRVLDYCVAEFGTARVEDATGVWTEASEEEREMKITMVVGGEGWRKF